MEEIHFPVNQGNVHIKNRYVHPKTICQRKHVLLFFYQKHGFHLKEHRFFKGSEGIVSKANVKNPSWFLLKKHDLMMKATHDFQ